MLTGPKIHVPDSRACASDAEEGLVARESKSPSDKKKISLLLSLGNQNLPDYHRLRPVCTPILVDIAPRNSQDLGWKSPGAAGKTCELHEAPGKSVATNQCKIIS